MSQMEMATTRLVLMLELDEARARWERVIGKTPRLSAATDEQSALQEHMRELQCSMQVLDDGNLAQSLSNAMRDDNDLLAFYEQMERRETADRAMALSLSPQGTAN